MARNLDQFKQSLAEMLARIPMLPTGPEVYESFDLIEKFVETISNLYSNDLSEGELTSFIFDEISEHCTFRSERREPAELKEYLTPDEFNQFVEQLLSELASLPHRYHVYFLCPQVSRKGQGFFRFGKDISTFESINDDREYRIPSEDSFGKLDLDELQASGLLPGFYVRINCYGIASRSVGSSAIEMALRRFKIVLASLIASQQFKIGHGYKWFGPIQGRLFFTDSRKGKLREANLPHTFKMMLGKLELVEPGKKEGTTLGELAGLLPRVVHKPAIDLSAKGYELLFEFNRKTDLSHIQIASEWIIDALATDHSTATKALLVSAAIESVLSEGEKIESGLTEKLTDRCAYLLSMSLNQRRIVRDRFKKFYSVRSRLVHGGNSRLSDEDKASLAWGEKIALALINQETRRYGLGTT